MNRCVKRNNLSQSKRPNIVFWLFSSKVRSIFALLDGGAFLTEDFFVFFWSSEFLGGGLRAAKTKLLVFLAVVPLLASLLPFVISANFSNVSDSRSKKEPF